MKLGDDDHRADRGKLLVLGSIAVSIVLVAVYLAAGGASYEPAKVRDPCQPRAWRARGLQEIAEQFSLSALDGAACELGVSRESWPAPWPPTGAGRIHREVPDQRRRTARAVRAGLLRAVSDAEEAGALSPILGMPLRSVLRSIPFDEAIELINNAEGLLGNVQSFLGSAEGLMNSRRERRGHLRSSAGASSDRRTRACPPASGTTSSLLVETRLHGIDALVSR